MTKTNPKSYASLRKRRKSAALFDAKTAEKLQMADKRWHINDNAFDDIQSYQAIIGGAA
jgi:hypothetical protein